MTSRQETRSSRRWILVALLVFLICLVLWIAAALILNIAFAESLPFSLGLRSKLAANYAPDEFVGSLGVFRLSIIDEVLRDRGLSPEEAEEQSERIKEAMKSPVPTATARDFEGNDPFTSTPTGLPTGTTSATPTETPSPTNTLAMGSTATDTAVPASATPSIPSATPTFGPSPTCSNTPTPTPTPDCSLITITDFVKSGDRVQWSITNGSVTDIKIEGISLAWPSGNGRLEYVVLDGDTIWDLNADPPSVIITSGWTGKSRVISTIPPPVDIEFDFDNTAEPDSYPMSLTFDNGCVISPPIPTSTPTSTATSTPTSTPTPTSTSTPTATATATPTPTASPTATSTPTPSACTAGTLTLITTGDAWIDGTAPGTNHGFDSNLHVRPTGGSDHRTLIQFGLTAIPSTCTTITNATLRIYQKDSFDQTIEIFRIIEFWIESDVTWATAPNYSSTVRASFSGLAAVPTIRDIDVTTLVQDWVSGTDNYGFLLKSKDGSGDIQFSSREGSPPPELIVNYAP